MARGQVIWCKINADGDLIGRSNANPILDTWEYEVEFSNGEVTELTTNVIVEAMFSQCKDNCNKYVLLDSLVDYRKNKNTLSLKDKKIIVKGESSLHWSTVGW